MLKKGDHVKWKFQNGETHEIISKKFRSMPILKRLNWLLDPQQIGELLKFYRIHKWLFVFDNFLNYKIST